MYSSCQNKAEGAVGMDPASHILSKDSGWKNDKIQQCLSFTPRIANLRILILCPAPTRLKFCEGAVLLLRDKSNLPTSMPHLGHRAWQIFFQPNVFSQLEAGEQSLSSFADLCSSAGSWQLWSLPKCFLDFPSEAGITEATHLSPLRLLVLWKQTDVAS